MPDSVGTRSQQNFTRERTDQGGETRNHSRDLGMTKRLVATLTFGGFLATAARVAAAGGASSHNYVPTDTITLAGGTSTTASVLTVDATKVVSAAIVAAGSGGTDGVRLVTGTTGTGTKFTAWVSIVSGAIDAVLEVATGGLYTANPTDLTAEPVVGAGLTGATLLLLMGVGAVSVTTAGVYSVAPSNPVAQGSSSGSGTGATFNMTYGALNKIVGSNGDFTNFAAGEQILVEGTNLNNGFKVVTGIDSTNHAYLKVDPPPKYEASVANSLVRTP